MLLKKNGRTETLIIISFNEFSKSLSTVLALFFFYWDSVHSFFCHVLPSVSAWVKKYRAWTVLVEFIAKLPKPMFYIRRKMLKSFEFSLGANCMVKSKHYFHTGVIAFASEWRSDPAHADRKKKTPFTLLVSSWILEKKFPLSQYTYDSSTPITVA